MAAINQSKYAIKRNGKHIRTVTVKGRQKWALDELNKAGATGCTPIHHPAPRWSGYVFDLRVLGIEIETIHERHSGPFPGTHGRYVLRDSIVEVSP